MDEDSTVQVVAMYCCCQTCLAPSVIIIIIIAVIPIAPYLTDKGKHRHRALQDQQICIHYSLKNTG